MTSKEAENKKLAEPCTPDRRDFLSTLGSAFMASGLVAGYGMFVYQAGKFLYPSSEGTTVWQFVSTLDGLSLGESLPFLTASGAKIVVARQGEGQTADDFIALSSVCPHLGCAVHWESQNDRFFCPCHNGAFDAQGQPTEGPPAAANQPLTEFPLRIQNGLLYIEVSTDSISIPERA